MTTCFFIVTLPILFGKQKSISIMYQTDMDKKAIILDPLNGTFDWKFFKNRFIIPENSTWLEISFYHEQGIGKAWIDDVSLISYAMIEKISFDKDIIRVNTGIANKLLLKVLYSAPGYFTPLRGGSFTGNVPRDTTLW